MWLGQHHIDITSTTRGAFGRGTEQLFHLIRGIHQRGSWFNPRGVRDLDDYQFRLAGKYFGGATLETGEYAKGGLYADLRLCLDIGVDQIAPVTPQLIVLQLEYPNGKGVEVHRQDYDISHFSMRRMSPEIPYSFLMKNLPQELQEEDVRLKQRLEAFL